MNTDAIRRFLTALSSAVKFERGQLYQLVQSAEASYCWRDIESQRDIGLALQSFAYPFNQVGKYYESVYLFRTGQYDKAKQLLENVADSAPAHYRSRALLSLSAVEEGIGRFEESLRLRLQASSCDDPVMLLEAQWGIATLRSMEGDHRTALRDLERLMPLAHIVGKRSHPVYFKFLNSYAIELSKIGRTKDAEQVANIVATSPLLIRYREWQETLLEFAEARRNRSSIIAVSSPKRELRLIRDSRIQTVIDFMETNFRRKISLGELAGIANVSQSHFSRIFKIQTGYSPIEYLIRIRVEKARDFLRSGSLRVKEAMALAGFDTKSNFTGHFKRHFGYTPYDCRRRILATKQGDN